MRTKRRLVSVAFAAVIIGTFVFVVLRQNVLDHSQVGGVTPDDLFSSKLSPALRGILEKADPHEPISVWVEFDPSVYETETGTSLISLARKYRESMIDKIQRNATEEFLPEEIILMTREGRGLSLPVELEEQQIYLEWYMVEYTPSWIKSIAAFPGIQLITLREPYQQISSKADPIFAPYMNKVAEEYPGYRIELLVDIRKQLIVNPDTGEWREFMDLNQTRETVEKFGGKIATYWTDGVLAIVPPNPQILVELSALEDVIELSPSWVFSAGW